MLFDLYALLIVATITAEIVGVMTLVYADAMTIQRKS